MSKYKVSVNGNDPIDISSQETNQLDLQQKSTNSFHLLHHQKSFHADIISSNFQHKTYEIKVNNNVYQVTISDPLDQLIKDMGFEIGASKFVNDIKAPMPGLILDIPIKVGDQVKENDALIILEAMKMENVITSPRDGVIKSIDVTKGEAVDKNQLLIEFE